MMTESRYAEAHSLTNLLLRFADDAGSSRVYFDQPGVVEDAEARIRELIDQEESEMFHRTCDEAMQEYRRKQKKRGQG